MQTIFHVFLSDSPKIEKLNTAIGEIANMDVPVLIKGETGTGKEIIFSPASEERKMIQFFPRPQAGENEIAIGAMPALLFFLPGRQFILPWKTHPEMSPRPASTANLGLRNATKKFPHGRGNHIFLAAQWQYKITSKH